jgi:hypothetical protein
LVFIELRYNSIRIRKCKEVFVMAGESPIPGLKVAGPEDLKDLLKMMVVMDVRWLAWFNQRVLDAVKQGWKRRLTHLKFVPDVENGLVYILAALKEEYGALKLEYSPTEAGAMLSLYIPLLPFDLGREERRHREFDVVARTVEGVTYLALDVRNSRSVPARKRADKGAPATTPAARAAAASDADPAGET